MLPIEFLCTNGARITSLNVHFSCCLKIRVKTGPPWLSGLVPDP